MQLRGEEKRRSVKRNRKKKNRCRPVWFKDMNTLAKESSGTNRHQLIKNEEKTGAHKTKSD